MSNEEKPAAAPKRRAHFQEVDAMRAFAALGVILAHTLMLPYFSAPHSAAGEYLDFQSSGIPRTPVVVFFAISGLVLYRPFIVARYRMRPMPSLTDWLLRRAARIAPGYWVVLAVTGIVFGYHYLWTPSGFLRYFGFGQIYGTIHTLGGGLSAAWTLCVEASFYVAMPVIVIVARGLGRYFSVLISELVTCGLVLAFSVVWEVLVIHHVAYSGGWQISVLSWLPGCIGMFAAGMFLAVLSVEVQFGERPHPVLAAINRWPEVVWALAIGILYLEAKISPTVGEAKWWVATNLVKILAAALLLAPFVLGQAEGGPLRRLMRWRPLVWTGTVSFGIYLWHDPLLMKIGPHINSLGPVLTVAIVFIGATGLGAASYYAVELPAQRLAQRWEARRRRPQREPAEPRTALGVPIIGPAVAEAAAANAAAAQARRRDQTGDA